MELASTVINHVTVPSFPVHRTNGGPVKLYANVPSRSRPGKFHLVTYVRRPGITERWTCTCEDQTFVKSAKNKNCDHIKDVKSRGFVKSNGRPILNTFSPA